MPYPAEAGESSKSAEVVEKAGEEKDAGTEKTEKAAEDAAV